MDMPSSIGVSSLDQRIRVGATWEVVRTLVNLGQAQVTPVSEGFRVVVLIGRS